MIKATEIYIFFNHLSFPSRMSAPYMTGNFLCFVHWYVLISVETDTEQSFSKYTLHLTMEWMSLVGINSAPNRRWKQAIWKFISPAHKRNPELDGPRLLWQPHIVLWDPRAFYPWIPLSSVHSYFRVIIWSKMAAGAPAIVSSFHVGKNVRLCLHSQRANKQLFFFISISLSTSDCNMGWKIQSFR